MGFLLSFFMSTAFASSTGSSTLKDENGKHTPNLAVDGSLNTSWAAESSDKEPWFQLKLNQKTEIKTLSIWPGDISNGKRSYTQSSRPKVIRIFVDDKQIGEPRRIQDLFKRFDFKVGATGKTIKIVVDDQFEGVLSSHLFISEIAVNFDDRSIGKRFDKWLSSTTGNKLQEKHDDKVKEHYLKIKNAEFGDKEAFEFLCEAAANGAKYQQKQLPLYVPEGYRIQIIDSSPKAVKALKLLKDANSIPCLEQSALRSNGKEAHDRWSEVGYYYALQKLIGGPNFRVKAWGQSGWSRGELQSFEEPLPLEIDPFGMVWVADTGNNRLQLFNEKGLVKKIFGEDKPSIVNRWFKKGRDWYVSGSPAEEKAGQFANPVDIVFIPKKKDTFGFATLDANGRIQVFDETGKIQQSWKAQHSFPASQRQGGTAYLTYLTNKKALCAIIQDSGSCYKLSSEQISTFEIKDGTPTSVESLKNGKMLMSFNDQVVMYSHDGFRHRVIIDKKILGPSFEFMDMTLDEKNKLWILTDFGEIFKFKSPGKVDFKLRITDIPLKNPRIAVQDNVLYMLFEDHIEVIDILQARIDAEEAQKAQEENK